MGQGGDARLDLIITNKVELSGAVVTSGSFDCWLPWNRGADAEVSEGAESSTDLGFRRAGCGLFRELAEGFLYEAAWKGKRAQENWQVFKDNLLQLHEHSILILKKLADVMEDQLG